MLNKYVFCGVLLAGLIAGCGREDSKADKEAIYIVRQQQRIEERLRDPSSAQFRDVFVGYGMGTPIVCGHVNSKNAFGGYVGYQRFISGGDVQVLESEVEPGGMDVIWAKICARKQIERR